MTVKLNMFEPPIAIMNNLTNLNGVEVEWIGHAWVKLESSNGSTIHIDPWSDVSSLDGMEADIIVSTHDHFDHFDTEAIQDLAGDETVLLCTEESENKVPEGIDYRLLKSGETVESHGIEFKGFPAYNIDKFRESGEPFHPEGFCVGVVFELDGVKFYHASDTDPIDEMRKLREENIDMAFLPIGGTYTMDQVEALEAVKMIKPGKVVPIHYGFIDETEADTEKFAEEVRKKTDTEPVILDIETQS